MKPTDKLTRLRKRRYGGINILTLVNRICSDLLDEVEYVDGGIDRVYLYFSTHDSFRLLKDKLDGHKLLLRNGFKIGFSEERLAIAVINECANPPYVAKDKFKLNEARLWDQ